MTRSDLISCLAARFPSLSASDAATCANEILAALAGTLSAGNRVEIRGFGSFSLNYRQPRKGRNPASGKAVMVPGKFVPHFRAGLELRERVNRNET